MIIKLDKSKESLMSVIGEEIANVAMITHVSDSHATWNVDDADVKDAEIRVRGVNHMANHIATPIAETYPLTS